MINETVEMNKWKGLRDLDTLDSIKLDSTYNITDIGNIYYDHIKEENFYDIILDYIFNSKIPKFQIDFTMSSKYIFNIVSEIYINKKTLINLLNTKLLSSTELYYIRLREHINNISNQNIYTNEYIELFLNFNNDNPILISDHLPIFNSYSNNEKIFTLNCEDDITHLKQLHKKLGVLHNTSKDFITKYKKFVWFKCFIIINIIKNMLLSGYICCLQEVSMFLFYVLLIDTTINKNIYYTYKPLCYKDDEKDDYKKVYSDLKLDNNLKKYLIFTITIFPIDYIVYTCTHLENRLANTTILCDDGILVLLYTKYEQKETRGHYITFNHNKKQCVLINVHMNVKKPFENTEVEPQYEYLYNDILINNILKKPLKYKHIYIVGDFNKLGSLVKKYFENKHEHKKLKIKFNYHFTKIRFYNFQRHKIYDSFDGIIDSDTEEETSPSPITQSKIPLHPSSLKLDKKERSPIEEETPLLPITQSKTPLLTRPSSFESDKKERPQNISFQHPSIKYETSKGLSGTRYTLSPNISVKPFSKQSINKGFKKPFSKQLSKNKGFKKPFSKQLSKNKGFKKPFSKQLLKNKRLKKPFSKQLLKNKGLKKPFSKQLLKKSVSAIRKKTKHNVFKLHSKIQQPFKKPLTHKFKYLKYKIKYLILKYIYT